MSGTVVFQSQTPATPGAGIVVGQDDVSGTAFQYVKLDVGPSGTSRPVSYASGTGVPVSGLGTFQTLGSVQTVGTSQVLGSVQTVGTSQALGSVQTVGTSQVLGSVQGVGTFQVLGTHQAAGTTLTKEIRSTAPSTSFVAGTIGNVILLAANPARLGAAIYLEGGSTLYLKFGSNAGTLDYTLQMQPSSYYEVPFNYMGTISGIWQFTGGTARVSEIT